MNRIVRAALPLLALLSLTLCTPASAGLVESGGRTEEASDLSGAPMAQSLAPEVLAGAHNLQHAGYHEIIIISAIVVLIVVGVIILVNHLHRNRVEVEVHDDDDGHRRHDHEHDHHGPGSP